MKVKSLSPVQLLATPWTAAHQAPPSMGFSRQDHWSGVPLPLWLYINSLGGRGTGQGKKEVALEHVLSVLRFNAFHENNNSKRLFLACEKTRLMKKKCDNNIKVGDRWR